MRKILSVRSDGGPMEAASLRMNANAHHVNDLLRGLARTLEAPARTDDILLAYRNTRNAWQEYVVSLTDYMATQQASIDAISQEILNIERHN